MKTTFGTLTSTLTLAAACLAFGPANLCAQDKPATEPARPERPARPRGDGERGERGERGEGGGFARMNPVVAALDANADGVIDEKELANAVVALKKLDKNGDGKLTQDELRPAGGRGRGPGGPGGADPEQMVTRLMQFDKNADGKLSKDELPERMQGMIERADTDKDGTLSKDEIRKMAETQGRVGGGGPGGPGGGEGRPRGERREGEGNQRQAPSTPK